MYDTDATLSDRPFRTNEAGASASMGVAGDVSRRVRIVADKLDLITNHICQVADRAFGGIAEPANEKGPQPPLSLGEVGDLHRALDLLDKRLREMNAQVDRIAGL